MKNGIHSNKITIATNAPEYFNHDDIYRFVALGDDSEKNASHIVLMLPTNWNINSIEQIETLTHQVSAYPLSTSAFIIGAEFQFPANVTFEKIKAVFKNTKRSRQSGVSRDTIHRHLRLVKQGDPEALKRQETPNLRHKNCVDKAIEDDVVQFSIEHPHLGQQKVAMKLSEALGVDISAGGVRSMWLRNNMNTTASRVEKSNVLAESA